MDEMSKGTPYISSMLARLAGAGAGRLTSSRVPRRRATPCRRRRRSTVAVHTAIVVATVVVATARRLVARPPHTSTTATLHTAAPVVAAAATRALKARPPPRLRVALVGVSQLLYLLTLNCVVRWKCHPSPPAGVAWHAHRV